MTETLHPSPRCLEIIKTYEGLRLKAYLCPAKIPTIGYGATGTDVALGMVWTLPQAAARLSSDIDAFSDGVRSMLTDAKTTQGQFDALVSFAYNCGLAALKGSTLLKRHTAGQHHAAQLEFQKWVKGGGKVLPGLVRRRAAEAALYSLIG